MNANTQLLDKRVFDAVSFTASPQQIAVAGQFSYGQLLNPAASGKVLIVRSIVGSGSVAGYMHLRVYSTALTTLVAAPGNKLIGSAATSVAQSRTQATASDLGAAAAIVSAYAEVGINVDFLRAGPIILSAGSGLLVRSPAVNSILSVSFEWEELNG